jgi:hypothetical protein
VKHLISGVNTCKRWAVNYKNRTHLYENILYHTAAQADNRMNGENAKTSIRITKLTKDDNKSFIALSVLAMLFLPGLSSQYLRHQDLFLSLANLDQGIFSMTFFAARSTQDFAASEWIWLYYVVTVPLMIIIFISRWVWKQRGALIKASRRNSQTNIEQGHGFGASPLPRYELGLQ